MKNSRGSFKPMRAVDGKLKPQFRWPYSMNDVMNFKGTTKILVCTLGLEI